MLGGLPRLRRPPRGGGQRVAERDRLAGARVGDALGRILRDAEALNRLGPPVRREVERGPVQREQRPPVHQPIGGERLLRPHVDVGPQRVVPADLDHREVERPEALPDLGEVRAEAAVAAVKDALVRAKKRPSRPERPVFVVEKPPRRVAGRRSGDLHRPDGRLLPPVQLRNLLRGHAPRFEVCAHAERHHKPRRPRRQFAHHARVEVVVVVVREDHGVERRKLGHRNRRFKEALHAKQPPRRGVRPDGRVGEEAFSVEFEQHRRVAEPCGADGGGGGVGQRRAHRRRRGRGCASVTRRKQAAANHFEKRRAEVGGQRLGETPVAVVRRLLHAGETLALGRGPEGGSVHGNDGKRGDDQQPDRDEKRPDEATTPAAGGRRGSQRGNRGGKGERPKDHRPVCRRSQRWPSAFRSGTSSTAFGAPTSTASIIARPSTSVVLTALGHRRRSSG